MPSSRIARVVVMALGVVVLTAVVLALRIADVARSAPFPAGADAAVVLGAAVWVDSPSPVFAARLDHAADLYQRGAVQRVFLTGGARAAGLTEAAVGRAYLVQLGVEAEDLAAEDRSRTTWQNLRCLADTLGDARPSLAVVSDPYHVRRGVGMARDLGFSAVPAPTPTSRYRSWRSKLPFLAREVWFTAVDAIGAWTGSRGDCPAA